jgi:hypothetical protein
MIGELFLAVLSALIVGAAFARLIVGELLNGRHPIQIVLGLLVGAAWFGFAAHRIRRRQTL